MVLQAIPGATYEYQEYPAVRYNAIGATRTITCAEQEEDGWYDSPTKANAERKKQLDKISARNATEKDAARKAKAGDQDDNALPTKAEVTRMNTESLLALAAKLEIVIPEDTKRPGLIKLINAKLEQTPKTE